MNCTYSPKDIQEKGRVYIYDLSVTGHAKLLSVIEGYSEFSKFGASLSIGRPFGEDGDFVLAVGAPSIGEIISLPLHLSSSINAIFFFLLLLFLPQLGIG